MKIKNIEQVLEEKGKLICYLMTGDPELEISAALIEEAAKEADVLELGVPFSDPIADGPVIQKSAERAMKAGAGIEEMFRIVRNIREKGIDTPIITMLYYNLVCQYGSEKFVAGLRENGLNGALIPDLPLEESKEIRELLKKNGLVFPMLISPTSGEERAGKIAEAATGFIYYVAYTGTTGSEVQVKYAALKEEIQKIQSRSHTPVVVGFGIKDRKDVKEVCSVADGAVVGSALIREIEKHRDKPDLVERVKAFILNLKS